MVECSMLTDGQRASGCRAEVLLEDGRKGGISRLVPGSLRAGACIRTLIALRARMRRQGRRGGSLFEPSSICDKCGSFFPSGIEATNSTNITLSGCTSGPCPACGGMGHIPNGLYNFIGNTIELLSGPSRTVSELERLAVVIKRARQQNASTEQVIEAIETEIPELSSLRDLLPKSRRDLYAFIAVIIAVINLIQGQMKGNEPPKVEISQISNLVYHESSASPAAAPGHPLSSRNELRHPHRPIRKIGRNELCPCGSGKKYKHCCLAKANGLAKP